jgi:ribonuclease HI
LTGAAAVDDEMTNAHAKLVLHVDGGARGNPGPAAIGVVVSDPAGELVTTFSDKIGETTNNVAEYRALLRGLELAAEHGASEIEVINDSELIARQVTGVYKVKHQAMQELHREAMALLEGFDSWSIESVPRAQNAEADSLVNEALDR